MIFFITNLSPFPSSVISSSIYFSSKCAFDLSLQTFLEGLTISYSGESVVSSSFFFFFTFESLLFKVSYATFYRKHCKEKAIVITHFGVIPQIYLLSFQNKKIKKIK